MTFEASTIDPNSIKKTVAIGVLYRFLVAPCDHASYQMTALVIKKSEETSYVVYEKLGSGHNAQIL